MSEQQKSGTTSSSSSSPRKKNSGDAKSRAEAKVGNPEGINVEPHDVTELQERVDEIQEQGYMGDVPDPTPNENYTVEGVTSGKPTPETDPDLWQEAHDAAVGNPLKNIEQSSTTTAKGEESDKSQYNKGGKAPPATGGKR